MKGLIAIPVIAFLIASCSTIRTVSEENIINKSTLRIYKESYKIQGKSFHELRAVLTDSSENIVVYWITSVCNCIRKEDRKIPRKQYKAVTDSNYDLELTNSDKIILQKFRALPEIEMFCSKSLLDSAKGFIQLRK